MTLFNLPPYLDWPAQFCLLSAGLTWIASLITSNVSQIDRLWTFLPTIYAAYYASLPALPNSQPFLFVPYAPKELGWASVKDYSPRALLMFSIIFIWMCRLSYNTYRRGLYSQKEEDYRWVLLRTQLPAWLFQVTNLTFIAATQNVLLLLLGLPVYQASVLQPHTPLVTSDYILTTFALTILALEFTADNQQFAFQTYKHAFLAKGKIDAKGKAYDPKKQWPGARLNWTPDDAKRGFVNRGLWRYSRHPNFACEQSFWWIITLFPLLDAPPPNLPRISEIPTLRTVVIAILNPDLRRTLFDSLCNTFFPILIELLPGLSHSVLFFSSTLYTEAISSSKYPEAYAAYQKRVGKFTPFLTLFKALKLKFVDGEKKAKEVDRLLWGSSYVKED